MVTEWNMPVFTLPTTVNIHQASVFSEQLDSAHTDKYNKYDSIIYCSLFLRLLVN